MKHRLLVIWGMVLWGAACTPASQPSAEEPILLLEPDDPRLLKEHLDVLGRPELQGRVTGSQSFALAAQYVEDRMREFMLQPALAGHYRIVYEARVHLPWPATLGWADQDSAAFYPGLEFWPDARSDTGRVVADQVVVCGRPTTCPPATVWVVAAPGATGIYRLAQERSVQAMLMVGPLRPGLSEAPIAGLHLLQVTPEAAGRLLGMPANVLQAQLADTTTKVLPLSRPLRLQVRQLADVRVGALNILGFVAGKDPELRKELVIVGADLDVVALPGSTLLLDGAHLGEGVAALLELARFYSTLAAYWPLPRRSLLFAVWSGARQGNQGIQAYLQQPLWELAATRRVVYLDPDPEILRQLQQLAARYGVPLHPVLPPDSLQKGRQLFFKVPEEGQQAYRRIYRRPLAVSLPDPEELRLRALQRARMLVQAAQEVLLPEVITPAPWTPVQPDTLPSPSILDERSP